MKEIRIQINDNSKSVLDYLREADLYLPAECGGRGSCGKCKVRFLNDPPAASDRDRALLTGEELERGVRLACTAYGEGDYRLEIEDDREEEMKVADSFLPDEQGEETTKERPERVAFAVDLGTTTIAVSLVDLERNKVIATKTGINHQRAYGADVLSRMDASNNGYGPLLQKLVQKDLDYLCGTLATEHGIDRKHKPVIISANTTMGHLLQGLSCRTLGVYPFRPMDISLHQYQGMTILPGISTYVGADIVSGIIACGIDRSEKTSILVDLGTNGEMVIGNKDRILVTSAAAGPAFEGGNISCGLAGIPGAIDTVTIRDGKPHVTTIEDRPPAGLCGTGVLETVYELVKEGIVDETGLMADSYFDEGYILAEKVTFFPKDVREVQMAKSAIRSGIEILLQSFGISYDEVDKFYLAGGFGQKMDCRKAAGIGLVPEELEDRIIPVGNSSLMGAVMYAQDSRLGDRYQHVIEISEEISLANHRAFNEYYLKYMYFNKKQ